MSNTSDQSPRRSHGLTSWRSVHRSRSHESAHAEEDAPESSQGTTSNPLVPRGPATLVTDQRGFDALIAELRESGSFAYDTEFIGELTYHPMLCLVQVATTQRV